MHRRHFLRQGAAGLAGLSTMDFLGYFFRFGLPYESRAFGMADDLAAEQEPSFLIYWFLEGGWEGYDMFNPVVTPNNVIHRLENPSDERYRVLKFGEDGYRIQTKGNIRYGYLAEQGKDLFPDMAVLSSMHTGSFHSGERLMAHMGSYNLRLTADREDDERSVMQAFAEAKGQSFLLPNLSWHRWLSDGELNEAQYTGRKGYYHALGPAHAHTVYAGTPAMLRRTLQRIRASANDVVNARVQEFLDTTRATILDDHNVEAVKSYNSARQIYQNLTTAGRKLDGKLIAGLFNDPELKARFRVKPEDELISYRSVNGNKARSKFSPNTNVQAMMAFELIRAGLGCGFWIESRDIRKFDSHLNRGKLWKDGRPVGQIDQTAMMNADLWEPLNTLVACLKETPLGHTGKSLWDRTTIVLTSEFGRTIHGDVEAIRKMKLSDEDKQAMIDGQDISQHWKVTSAAFLGGTVRGNRQYGGVGEHTLLAIPILPDGSLDPAYCPVTGELLEGCQKHPKSFLPNHGDVYATALLLAGVDPKGKGRNDRPPLEFIKKS
ncbi:MAG: DUF1501 domain-containing protein [Isosphaeraceae bacterium]|nr:DUF1501 domain-containing protein [Isosphaeraceae bacterium]